MDEEWGITICDPNMLLGVERTITEEAGVTYLDFKMPNYIKDCYLEWSAKMAEVGHPVRDYNPVVPFPEGTIFYSWHRGLSPTT